MVSIGLFGRRNTAVAIVVSAGADGILSVPYNMTRVQTTEQHGDDIFFPLE